MGNPYQLISIQQVDGLAAALEAAGGLSAIETLNLIKTVDGSGSGLDADTLDGYHATSFALSSVNYVNSFNTRFGDVTLTSGDVTAALTYTPLNAASYTAADVLSKLLTVDGPSSGLDADTLDGYHATSFALSSASYVNSFNSRTGAVTLTSGDVTTALTFTPLNAASYTAADVLTKILTVDGAASGLDSDLLDGQHGAYYLAAANFTGTLNAAQMPAHTGDVTSTAGSVGLTLATVNGNVGTFGSATASAVFTVNAKGLITAASSVTITPAWGSITSKPTTLAGYSITAADVLATVLTVDGAGSGLDADLFDGRDSSGYNRKYGGPAANADATTVTAWWSDIADTAISYISGGTNYPSSVGAVYSFKSFVGASNSNYARAFEFFKASGDNSIHVRGFDGTGVGTAWAKVWTNLNDGASSTLDADLLDGQEGTYYQNASNLNAGTIPAARLPAFTGDATTTVGTVALVLATVNGNVGSFGSATAAPTFTVNAKGLITAAGSVTITPAWGSVTSKPTTLAGYSITAADVLATIITVDGAASGLDADLLDGQHGSFFQDAGNLNAGTILAARMPAHTGDVTSTAGSVGLTLATVNGNVGTFGSATQAGVFTVNAKGLITAASNVTITPAWGSITSKPTTLSGYSISAADVIATVLTVDGSGSGLDADLLDGKDWISPGAIGSTTANTGSFTTLAASGAATFSNTVTLASDPVSPLQAATKQYVDNLAQGIDAKYSVRAATTANITLSAPQTIDGVSVIAGNRVLVKNQTAPAENGIYIVAAGAWTRSTDADAWAELPGAFTFVEEGTVNSDSGWICTVDVVGGTLGTTAVTWVQFSGAGTYTASNGITKSGSDFQLTGQALAVHNLSSSGLIVRTGSGTVAARTLTAPAAGITVSNGDGVSGNPTIALANDLAAVEGLTTTGFVRRTGVDTWTANNLTSGEVTTALGFTPLNATAYTAADVLAKILTVDGIGSGLDADLLDGQNGSYYLAAANFTGTLNAAQMPALTGDVTTVAGALGTTLATVNGNVGSFGSATAAPTFTVNAKGLITAAGSVTITPAWSSITSKPTTLAGYSITAADVLAALLTVDGAASGLDADLLDGQQGSYYQNAGNLNSGTILAARMPAFTGDITTSAGALATTLATVNGNVGSFGSATQSVSLTVNAKGLITAASHATITPAWSSITSKPTTISGYGITNAVPQQDGTRSNLDYNATLTSGFYNVDNAPTNGPSGHQYSQLIVARGIDTGLQIAGGYNKDLYFRGFSSTGPTFYGWNKIWHDNNDGAASGLDADLLDGQQGSYYQNAGNLNAGTILAARMPAFTGDVTTVAGALATTLATVNGNVGSFGSATQVGTFTVNAKGLITAASNVTVTPAWSSITSKPTTLAGYSITAADVLAALLTVDGSGSGLDADLLDGQSSAYYQNAGNLNAGTLLSARMPAFTGDITTVAGAVATTLATVNGNVGTFGSATQSTTFTVNAKGLVTAASHATITPAWSSITSKPTTLSGYGITELGAITGAALIGFSQGGTGAVSETVEAAIRRGAVTPEEYGAVGNGSTDDTTAVQAAINTGRPVWLSEGKTYKTSSTLTVSTDHQNITGSGKLQPDGSFDCITITNCIGAVVKVIISSASHSGGWAIKVLSADRVTIRLYAINVYGGIYVEHCNVCTLEWVYMACRGPGIKWYGTTLHRSDLLICEHVYIGMYGDGFYGLDWDGNCNSLEVKILGIVNGAPGGSAAGAKGIIVRNTSGGPDPIIGRFDYVELDYPTGHGIEFVAPAVDIDIIGAYIHYPYAGSCIKLGASSTGAGNLRVTGGKLSSFNRYAIENAGSGYVYIAGNVQTLNDNGGLGTYSGDIRSVTPRLNIDDTLYLTTTSGNPLLGLDTNDYMIYDRTNNILSTIIGGTNIVSLATAGAVFDVATYAPTAALNTNNTQVATTAFVVRQTTVGRGRIFVEDYGAVSGNSAIDNAAAIAAAEAAAAAINAVVVFKSGASYYFKSQIGGARNDLCWIGEKTSLIYNGASTTTDLMVFGDNSTSYYGMYVKGISIKSLTTMTAGSALRTPLVCRSFFDLDSIHGQDFREVNGNKLYNGIYADRVDNVRFAALDAVAQNNGFMIRGATGGGPKADCWVDIRKVCYCAVGFLIGGAFGGVYLGATDYIVNGIDVLANQSLQAEENRELFLNNTICDGATNAASASIVLDDPGALLVQINGPWIASGAGHGIWIKQSSGKVLIANPRIWNFAGDGIRNDAGSSCVVMINGAQIHDNDGWGVNATSAGHHTATTNSHIFANTLGNLRTTYAPASRPVTNYADFVDITSSVITASTQITSPVVYIDSTFASYLSSGNPFIGFAANDYLTFDRTADRLAMFVGGGQVWSASASGVAIGPGNDVLLVRDAANVLALANGANAQTFRIYKTTGVNSEYLSFSAGTAYSIGAGSTGSGIARDINISVWAFASNGKFNNQSDNTYDMGSAASGRAKTIYVGTSVVSPKFEIDTNFYAQLSSANPAINLDANDYLHYNRTTNTFSAIINSGSAFSATATLFTTAGGITTGGALSVTGTGGFSDTITSTKAGGTGLYLNGATSNRIAFNNNGVAAPTFTTGSAGEKITLYQAVAGAAANYGLGIEGGAMWLGVSTTANSFKFYGGTTVAATLAGTGALTLTAGLSATTGTFSGNVVISGAGTGNSLLIQRNHNDLTSFTIYNATAGTAARASAVIAADVASATLDVFSSGWTPVGGGDAPVSGARFLATGAGGWAFRASHASGTIRFYTGSTERLKVDTTGHLLPGASNSYDLGASGNTFRAAYLGTSITAPIHYVDTNFSLQLISSNPTITFDSTDTLVYDRTNNAFISSIGGTARVTTTASATTFAGNILPGTDNTYNLGSTSARISQTYAVQHYAYGNSPSIFHVELDQASGGKVWAQRAEGGVMTWGVESDAYASPTNFMTVTRSGLTVTALNLAATAVTINSQVPWLTGTGGIPRDQWLSISTRQIFYFDGSINYYKAVTQHQFRNNLDVTTVTFDASGNIAATGTIISSSYLQGTAFYADAAAYFTLSSGNPVLGFDANDYISYNRASNIVNFVIGASVISTLDASRLTTNVPIKVTPVAVGSLPTGAVGDRHFVTDATATTFASIVAGGGANKVPVYHDGTNWRIG